MVDDAPRRSCQSSRRTVGDSLGIRTAAELLERYGSRAWRLLLSRNQGIESRLASVAPERFRSTSCH